MGGSEGDHSSIQKSEQRKSEEEVGRSEGDHSLIHCSKSDRNGSWCRKVTWLERSLQINPFFRLYSSRFKDRRLVAGLMSVPPWPPMDAKELFPDTLAPLGSMLVPTGSKSI